MTALHDPALAVFHATDLVSDRTSTRGSVRRYEPRLLECARLMVINSTTSKQVRIGRAGTASCDSPKVGVLIRTSIETSAPYVWLQLRLDFIVFSEAQILAAAH
jgi:hypothetical protein